MRAVPPTDEDKRATRLQDVMHFWLYETIGRLNNNVAQPTANESKFVRDGKANVRIELVQISAQVRNKLIGAGLEIDSLKGTVVKGRIAIKKLAGVANVSEVKYITPAL